MNKIQFRSAAFLLLSFTIAQAGQVKRLIETNQLENKAVFIPKKLGNIVLLHDKKGFMVKKNEAENNKKVSLQPCFIDKELRGISKENLTKLIAAGAKLSLNNIGDDEYSLKLKGGLNGGGWLGGCVGTLLGYGGVHAVTEGACMIVSAPVYIFATPAAGQVFHAGISAVAHKCVEPVAHSVAIGTGIVVATATGPI